MTTSATFVFAAAGGHFSDFGWILGYVIGGVIVLVVVALVVPILLLRSSIGDEAVPRSTTRSPTPDPRHHAAGRAAHHDRHATIIIGGLQHGRARLREVSMPDTRTSDVVQRRRPGGSARSSSASSSSSPSRHCSPAHLLAWSSLTGGWSTIRGTPAGGRRQHRRHHAHPAGSPMASRPCWPRASAPSVLVRCSEGLKS